MLSDTQPTDHIALIVIRDMLKVVHFVNKNLINVCAVISFSAAYGFNVFKLLFQLPIAVVMPNTMHTGYAHYPHVPDKVINEYATPIVLAYNGVHHYTATE